MLKLKKKSVPKSLNYGCLMSIIRYIPIHVFLLFHWQPGVCKANVGKYWNSGGYKSLSLGTGMLSWSKQTAQGENGKIIQNYLKCKVLRTVDKLTTFMCRLSWSLRASTSWNPQGLSRPVMGLLYLYLYLYYKHRSLRFTAIAFSGTWYVVGPESFRPDQLFKVTEIKQLCYFST